MPSAPTPKPRPHILTVDDAVAVRQLARRTLAPFDCEVSDATNGFNALFAMERALPDLILLDINMPIMGGAEMLEMMRSNPALRAIPVILLTSPADNAFMPALTALGTSGHVMKPFNAATLLEKIRSVLPLKPASPPSAPA
jgi:CheY-like chemotaxis protein